MSLPHTTPDRIEAWFVALPMAQSFTSARSQVDERRLLIIRITTDGHCGWGEAAPVPGHTIEQADELWSALSQLVTTHGLDAPTGAAGMLAAAFSQARDDARARADGTPLWEALHGGRDVPASAAIGVGADGQPDFGQIESAAAGGYRHAKLKITPRTDAALIAEAGSAFSGVTFGVDANGTLGRDDLKLLRALDELGLSYIEQAGNPEDLDFHATLRQACNTPIGLDETASSEVAIESIIDHRAADLINLKVGRFGPAETVRLAERIVAAGLAVRVGGLLESGIGRSHSVAVASHPLFAVTGDIAGSDRYFTDDLVRPQWRIVDGLLPLHSRPGIGVDVNEAALAAHTIEALRVG
ncbi:MAG: hypothetical protein GY722_14875 [bacterium]|nr:hypothetical protein [bacterium]